jgi:hypothetical protein
MKIFTTIKVFLLMLLLNVAVQAQNNVTFKVDMSNYVGLNDTVYVNGTWNSWCGRCNPMVKQGTTNIWQVTLPIPVGAQEYKFTIGGWNAQEALASSLPCTVTNGGFTYRLLNVTTATVLPVVCWNSCLACTSLLQMSLPVNFDSANVDYVLQDFGGNASLVFADPVVSTNKVAKVTKSNIAESWAGTTIGSAAGFVSAIPFAANANKMTLRVYSPDSGIAIRLKVEDPSDGTKSVETEARTIASNTWQTLEFNFAIQAPGTSPINYANTYKKASVFFNFGVTGASAGTKVYYCDDLKFVPASGPILAQIKLPINFDSTNVNYTMTDFGGTTSSVVADPTNAANKVGKVIKSNTAETWAGTTCGTPSGLAEAIPFTTTNSKVSMMVYSPDSGIAIRLKAEDPGDPTKSVETEARTTVANSWHELEFNFANQAAGTAQINYSYSYRMLSVFFNFGVTGATAGTKTYHFDNVRYAGAAAPVVSQVKLPITFDSSNVNYSMVDFGGNMSSVVVDPNNVANKVAKVIKANTAETWAGTTMSTTAGLAEIIPFSASATKIRVRIFSPDTGITVKLKAEVPTDNTKSVETDTKTTVANSWQVIEFDFSKQSAGTAAINYAFQYKMLSIFFNFGVAGSTAGNKTYYFDDVMMATTLPPPPTKVNVKFTVDTKNIPMNAGDTVTLNGTFNGWCGACNKMTNIVGTKIWTTTIALDTAMEYEYKYAIGAWVSQENLSPTLACTKTTSGFTNRIYKSKKVNDSIPMVCWETCNACSSGGPTKTNLTFRVDMSKYALNAGDTVTLNGSFNNWCGKCTPMTKLGTSNIWAATVLLDKDTTYDFKYVIGNWASQEILKEGMACTTTKSGFTNRSIKVTKDNDSLAVVCWESCLSCQNTVPKAKVTFKVNMKNYVGDLSKGVTLNGTFNGWCGDCTKMTLIGDNIYAATVNLDTGGYEFKYSIGNWDDQESFSPSDLCTKTTGTFTNRYMVVSDTAAKTIGAYCWNTCTICDAVGLANQVLNSVKMYPNPATDNVYIDFGQTIKANSKVSVYNVVGALMMEKANTDVNAMNGLNLNVQTLTSGIYLVKIELDQAVKTYKLLVE